MVPLTRRLVALSPLALVAVAALAWTRAEPPPVVSPGVSAEFAERAPAALVEPVAADARARAGRTAAAVPARAVAESGGRGTVRGRPSGESRARRSAPPLPAAIRLRVVDATDERPLPGVRLLARRGSTRAECWTDGTGRAEIPWKRWDGNVYVRLRAAGYAYRTVEAQPRGEQEQEVEVELCPQLDFEGVVVDRKTRVPVAGAKLWVGSMGRQATSDAFGRFTIRRFAFGRPASIDVTADGYATQTVRFDGGPEGERVLELAPARRLFGRVVDHSTGAAVAGVRLEAPGGEAETDAYGRFDFEVLLPGDAVRVELARDGYCDATAKLAPSGAGVLVRLPRTASIAGVVRDEDGVPVKDARVRRARSLFVLRGGERERVDLGAGGSELPLADHVEIEPTAATGTTARTDEHGRFRLDGFLPAKREAALEVFHAGSPTRKYLADARAPPGGTAEVELFPGCPAEEAFRAAVTDATESRAP